MYYFCESKNEIAQVAELVDALVSNTNGAIRAGSSPALGTKPLSKRLFYVSLFHTFACVMKKLLLL